MKKRLGRKTLGKEASFWKKLGRAVKENPGKICHK